MKYFYIFVILLTMFLSFWKGTYAPDPDLYWRLPLGTYIGEHGVPAKDIYTFTMPEYAFIDHEWLLHVIMSTLHPFVGFEGLGLLYTLFFITLCVVFATTSWSRYTLLPLSLVALTLVRYTGIRPQVLGWVFYAVLLYLLLHMRSHKRLWMMLTLLMLAWVNLHGSFGLGMVTIGIFVFFEWVQKRLNFQKALLTLGVPFLATGITPYGFRIWFELQTVLSDVSLLWRIDEWAPAFLSIDVPFYMYCIFSVGLFILNVRTFQPFEVVLYIITGVAGFISARQVPFWLIVSFPLFIQSLSLFVRIIVYNNEQERRLALVWRVVDIMCVIAIVFQTLAIVKSINGMHEDRFYPQHAFQYVKTHALGNERIFTLYHWGGYAIYHFPETKVFIDGRMPSWKMDKVGGNISTNAYQDYTDVFQKKINTEELKKKYGVALIVTVDDVDGRPFDHLPLIYQSNVTNIYALKKK